jgi:hypothetical protein
MPFKQYNGRGFMIYCDGPAGPDGRKKQTSVTSCPASDFPEVLAVLMGEDDWVRQDEKFVPEGAVQLYERPSMTTKRYQLKVVSVDHLRTVIPDPPKALQPSEDSRTSID